jgi:hypothetical protein
MEYLFPFAMVAILLIAMAFQAGQLSKQYPSEEEMIRHIVERRVTSRVRKEIEDDLANEINRQAAG